MGVGQRQGQLPGGIDRIDLQLCEGKAAQPQQPAGPRLAELVTTCPADHLDHETCSCRERGEQSPAGPCCSPAQAKGCSARPRHSPPRYVFQV